MTTQPEELQAGMPEAQKQRSRSKAEGKGRKDKGKGKAKWCEALFAMGQHVKIDGPKIVCDNIGLFWLFFLVTLVHFEYPRIRTLHKLGGPDGSI